jgi:hypothetical protein
MSEWVSGTHTLTERDRESERDIEREGQRERKHVVDTSWSPTSFLKGATHGVLAFNSKPIVLGC